MNHITVNIHLEANDAGCVFAGKPVLFIIQSSVSSDVSFVSFIMLASLYVVKQ